MSKAPIVVIRPRYLTVKEGEPVMFTCEATGLPTPTLEWNRGGGGDLSTDSSFIDGVFRIPAARRSDESEYYCKGTNVVGQATVRTILYVMRATVPAVHVIIRQTSVVATAGSVARLECYAQEGGDVVLIWTRQQRSLPSGSSQDNGVLTIPNVQPSHSGVYVCTGTVPTGIVSTATATLTIEAGTINERPTATIEPDRQTVNEGTTGTLRCIVTGVPRPTVQWSRVRGELSQNHQVNGEILRITQATMADRGIYMCFAENVAGRSRASAVVEVERRSLPKIDLYPGSTTKLSLGGSAMFQCRVMDGMPPPSVVWARAGNEQFTVNTKVMDNGVIMFERVTGPEQGTYICSATNEVGTISASATLTITGPPKIMISPSRLISVVEGQRVTVECTAEGDPTPNVSWQDIIRPPGAIFDGGETFGSAILQFNSIRVADAGTYTCRARNDGGVSEERVQIQVDERVNPTVVIGGPGTLAVTEGQNVELTCTTTGLINPAVFWRRQQGVLPPGHTVSGRVLFIPNIQEDYQGTYVCRATAGGTEYETSVKIIISVAPQVSVSPNDVTARPGTPLILRCNAQGTPPISYEWSKVGSALSPTSVILEDGTLEIRQVTAADAGTYRCVAVNTVGQGEGLVRVSIVVPPTVTVPASQETRVVGQVAELRCIATGTPAPVVLWEREGGENLPAQHSIRRGILTLYSLQREDEGRYVCVASNDGGTNRAYVYLVVQARPETGSVQSDTKTVDVGDRVEFECVVTGAPPPTVSWRKLEGPLPEGSIREGGILIIPKVKPTDAGTYRCTATNTAGSVETQVILFVRAQPVIGVAHDVQTAALGEGITLGCEATGFPQPVVTWSKQYGELPREHSVVDGDLSIPLLRREDAGTYMCNAVNQYGRTEQPVKLIIGDLVPYFPQAPLSYMSYRPLRDAYMDFDIEVSFRPEATDGLVMYNGQYDTGNGDFICFGMRGSKPEFRFDVGSGPAIIQGNHSLELNKWHTIQLKRNRRDGTMLVNDEPAYMGSAGGRFVGLDLEQNMYLGGVPNFNNIPRASGFNTGFVGSISEVKLQTVDLDLGDEALEIVGIKQSQVCQEGACDNGGTCEPANVLHGFRCTCPQGFAGLRCDVRGERCYPGACGADGRCYNLPTFTGFRCVCPIGRYGKGCQEGLTISKPAFARNAFISYPTIEDGLIQVTVKLVFKLQSLEDGIILYNSQKNDGDGDFISLSIKDGYLEFRYDTGSGPAILRSQRPLRLNEWFTIVAERDGSDGTLIVNSDVPVRGSSQGNTMGLNLKSKLFLGGADPAITVSPSVGVTQGFVGCVEELEINDREIDLLKSAIESANIKDCGDRRPCDRRPCQNGGTCQEQGDFDYICVCHRDFTGKDCNMDVNICSTSRPCQNGGICHAHALGGYSCDCQLNFMGRDCETSIIMESSVEVRGNGWLELSRALLPHRSSQIREVITFSIETTERDGLIFWQAIGANEQLRGRDFIAVAVKDGYIEFSFELGNGVTVIRSDAVRVDDGYKHDVSISRAGRSGSVTVDRNPPARGDSVGSNQMLNTKGNIYLGGAPDLSRMTDNRYKHSFNGCIRDLVIQNKGPIRFSYDAVSAINAHPCIVI